MHHFFKERITLKRIVFGIVFVALLGLMVTLQHEHLEEIRPSRPYRDSLYLPRGEYVELLSLGYDMAMADFLWIRAIQAFGGHFLGDKNYTAIINLFDVITDLNPWFISAYLFGNTVIGEEAGMKKQGLALIDKGLLKAIRRTYRLGYWGGYDATWNIGDFMRAKYFFRMALKCEDCPDYVNRLLAYLDEKLGNYHIAFQKRLEDYLRAIDKNNEILEGISYNKLVDIIREWHVAVLKDAAKQYKEKHGSDITSLQQLAQAKMLGKYRVPVLSRLEERVNYYLQRQEQLMPHYREILAYAQKEFNNQLPPEPQGTAYYIIYNQSVEDEHFISTVARARESTEGFLHKVRSMLEQHKEKEGSYPEHLGELFKADTDEELKDLLGKPWDYNPETGEIKSRSFPNL